MEIREINFCDATIRPQTRAWQNLMMTPIQEALVRRPGYGKKDTLGMDAIPEIIIAGEIRKYNSEAILVTEETDEHTKKLWPRSFEPEHQPLIFFSDPVDRSSFLEDLLRRADVNGLTKIGNFLSSKKAIELWEEVADKPAIITGATTSLTCVFRNKIVCSVIVNLITQTIFLASPAGIHYLKLPSFRANKKIAKIDFDYIINHGQKLEFLSTADTSRSREGNLKFVSYLGSEIKTGYKENFVDSMIFLEDPEKYLHHKQPGGPSRVLFLSELQRGFGSIGFVLGNGEKIGEWMPWLAFAKYARDKMNEPALKVFEISIKDKPRQKEGILMSTSPAYSIFEMGIHDDEPFIDINLLRKLKNKSHFRAMIVITLNDNDTIIHKMIQNNYREVNRAL